MVAKDMRLWGEKTRTLTTRLAMVFQNEQINQNLEPKMMLEVDDTSLINCVS